MTLRIMTVDPAYVSQMWPKVEGFIKDALQKGVPEGSGNYNEHHVQQYVAIGQWLLMIAIDEKNEIHGAATISFINYPLHRVAFVTTIGGRLVSSEDTYAQFTGILKQRGATKIQGVCRDSMVRLWQKFGAEPRNRIVEAIL